MFKNPSTVGFWAIVAPFLRELLARLAIFSPGWKSKQTPTKRALNFLEFLDVH